MPILRGPVTLSRFRIETMQEHPEKWTAPHIALRYRAFKPLDLSGPEERSAGFVELEDNDATEFASSQVLRGQGMLFTYRVDNLKIHPAMVKADLERWRKAFEAEHGRPPGRREKLEAKAEIRHSLRPRSPVLSTLSDVWWDFNAREVHIWTASGSMTDEVQDVLEQAFPVKLRPLVPVVVSDLLGVDDRAFAPTPALHIAGRAVVGDDAAEIEQGRAREQLLRGKAYLGREFLTWLLWRSESGDPIVEHSDKPVTVVFTDALTLRGITGEIVEETVRGAMAPYSPLIQRALDRGLLIHAGRLRITHGERVYQVGLDAERFVFRGGKLPAILSEEEDDRLDERLWLVEELTRIVHRLLETFLSLRATREWGEFVVPAMKGWMTEGAREAA